MTRLTNAAAVMIGLGLTAAAGAADKKTNYEEHVLPVLRAHCGSCHNANKTKGDVNVLSYGAIMKGGSSGAIVEAGNADGSKLFKVTAHTEEPKMPPSGTKIPDADLGILKAWINDGLIENPSGKAKTSNKPKMNLALAPGQTGKPTGPVAEPKGDWLMEPFIKTARSYMPYSMATSPWAPLVAVGGQKQVLIFNSNTFDLVGVLPFPEGAPNVVKFSRNGSLLLAGGGQAGKSGKVVLWNVVTGERVAEIGDEPDAVLAADVSADQTLVALGGSGKLVKIFSLKDGELLHTMKKHTEWVLSLEFSPDGVLLASGDRNGGLVVWESQSGREFYTLPTHTAAITAVSWRADSNILVSGSEDTTIRLWEMINGTHVKGWGAHGGGVLSLQVTHDGRIVSAGRDRVLKIWSPDGNMIKQSEGFNDLALRATFNHDGTKIVGADWSGTIRAFNVADAKRIAEVNTNPPTIAERIAAMTKEAETKKAEIAALESAVKAAQMGMEAMKGEQAKLQKAAADAANEVTAATNKVNEAKGAAAKAKQDVEAIKTQLPAKTAAVAGLGQNAQVVKEALGAAITHEKALATLESALAAVQNASTEMTAKAKAAGDKLAADAAVKTAAGRSGAVKQQNDGAVDLVRKALGESSQMVKEFTAASARHNQTVDAANAEVAALQKSMADKQKAVPEFENQIKAAEAMLPKIGEKKKAADAASAAFGPKLAAADAALKDATAKRDAAVQRVAAIPTEIAKLQRAQKFASVFKTKAELDSKTAGLAKAVAAAETAKTALDKAKLEAAEVAKKLPALTADAKAKTVPFEKMKPGLDAAAKEVAEIKSKIAAEEQNAKRAERRAGRAKETIAKSPMDKAAKETIDKAPALIKTANDAVAELKKTLAPKEAALGKLAAEFAPIEKASRDADKAADEAKSKSEALAAAIPKLEQQAKDLTALADKSKAALDAAKGLHAQAAGELAKVTAN